MRNFRNWATLIHSDIIRRLQFPLLSRSNRNLNRNMIMSSDVTSFGNFDLLKTHRLNIRNITLHKWKSRITGLTVLHIDYQAPLVKGYFVIPTEIFDDSGCPHTLEHLVFMGSEKYPYKGVLDNLANRAFSEGTNAWTDTDHTCYTIETAGQDGFLRLLPVYVDHILYPTISNHAFLTEVHHINGEGHNSGVVYSEMQGRENTAGDLMALSMARLVNPPGSAYRSETGGLMEALRNLTVQQIRDYHQKYYVPYNLCLIICGSVSQQSLLKVLQDQVEASIVKHAASKPRDWKRPFIETQTAYRIRLSETKSEQVEFPEDDETAGEVHLSMPGSAPSDYLTGTALEVLTSYLTSSPIAPLNKEFIETSNPLCTDISIIENTRVKFCDLDIYASSVPTEHLREFDLKLRESLKRIADEGVDMVRMKIVIDREHRQLLSRIESSGGDVFSTIAISDFLYAPVDGSDLATASDQLTHYNELASWSADQWSNLLRTYFVSSSYAVVYGKPSAKLAEKLETEERGRIEKQIVTLGPDGLAVRAKQLKEAQAYNGRPIPEEYFNSFPLPSVQNISWIPVESVTYSNGKVPDKGKSAININLLEHLSRDPASPTYYIEYSHVKSDFVTVHGFLSTRDVPDNLRAYISIYLNSFFSLPLKSSSTGETLSHEEVINGLENETVSYEIGLGLDGYFPQYVRISIKAEASKYDIALRWLHDLIYCSIFDKDRIDITAAKVRQSLPELRRDGNTVVNSLFGRMLYSSSSTIQASSIIDQLEFMPRLREQLNAAPDTVIQDLEIFRKSLIKSSGSRFGVTGNILAQANPKGSWLKAFSPFTSTSLDPVQSAYDTLSPLGLNPSKQASVMGLPSIESAYTIHSAKTIRGFNHPDFPALRVSLEVLNATEGFLWQVIRGAGLAYSAYIVLDLEAGILSFSTYRSSNPFQAYQEAKKIVRNLAERRLTLENSVLDSCKSAIVYAVAKRLSTPGKAALTALGNESLRGVPATHTTDLLEKYKSVTTQDVVNCIQKYLLPLFDPEQSFAAVVSGPSKLEDITQGLKSVGFQVKREELLTDGADDDSYSETDSSMTDESR